MGKNNNGSGHDLRGGDEVGRAGLGRGGWGMWLIWSPGPGSRRPFH